MPPQEGNTPPQVGNVAPSGGKARLLSDTGENLQGRPEEPSPKGLGLGGSSVSWGP